MKEYRKGRFLYINAWRNISDTPIQDNHLGVLDESSTVKPDDYIASDLFGEGYELVQNRLSSRNKHLHKWYYFSQMKKDEVLLFKQWDTDPTLTGRCCFHTAFKDLDRKEPAPTRESIEVRAVCFFPDHTPNTLPEFKAISENKELDEELA